MIFSYSIHHFLLIVSWLLLELLTDLSNIHERLCCKHNQNIKNCKVEIGFDLNTIILNLNDVMNYGCHFLVINCCNEVLLSVYNAHNLWSEMTILRYSAISNFLSWQLAQGTDVCPITLWELRFYFSNAHRSLHLVSLRFVKNDFLF